MSRFIPREAFALPALLIVLGTSAAVAPAAQAAGSWSSPVPLPGLCGGSVAVNAAGAQVTAGFSNANMSVQVCTSPDGQTWSAPVTLAPGISPAVAIAADGRAVAVWEGGPGTAAILQASVRPPGGQWSAPVTLATDYGQPVIGIDGSGNAIAAWVAANGAIDTASLPAGGSWTAVTTLAARGQALNLAVNSTGAAIITWGTRSATVADSGTVLGGFATPVNVGPAPSYPVGHTHVALNDAGQAALAWAAGAANMAATRSAGGTWSTPTQLSANPDGPVDVAIDGAGDAIAVFEQLQAAGSSYTAVAYTSKRPAGGTWAPPALLSVPGDNATVDSRAVADTAGTFVVAWQDRTTQTLNVLTSPPGGGFGPAATFPGVPRRPQDRPRSCGADLRSVLRRADERLQRTGELTAHQGRTPSASGSRRRSRSRPRARDLIVCVTGGSSTALLLGDQRSHALGVDCPLEDDRSRTNPVTPGPSDRASGIAPVADSRSPERGAEPRRRIGNVTVRGGGAVPATARPTRVAA